MSSSAPTRPGPAFVHVMIEAVARERPRAVALTTAHRAMTYGELNTRANRLARLLTTRGVGPESTVAIGLPPAARGGGAAHRAGTDHLVGAVLGMLATLKAGGAYVPIDLGHPLQRSRMILADARPVVLLAPEGADLPDGHEAALVRVDPGDQQEGVSGADLTDDDRRGRLTSRNAAYVIFTSGSTGRPKGVVVEHQALSDYLGWSTVGYPAAGGRTLVPTSLGFDLTVTGLFTPLAVGGAVHLLDLVHHQAEDVRSLTEWPATFMKVTPSQLRLLAALPPALSPTELLVVGGEQLLGRHVAEFWERRPGAEVVNAYGPTEAVVNCAEHRLGGMRRLDPGPVPIGAAQPGHRLDVLDEDQRPCDEGELYVGGRGLARGYLGRPDQTAQAFLPDPLGPPGSRRYRTGDIVRGRADGKLEFVGRHDGQVKVLGHRIELGEIDAALLTDPQVAAAASTVVVGPDGDPSIVGFVVLEDADADLDDIRRTVVEVLPRHLRPARLSVVDRLPMTANGKLDRSALAEPSPPRTDGDVLTPPPQLRRLREPSAPGVPTVVWVAEGQDELAALAAATPGLGAVDVVDANRLRTVGPPSVGSRQLLPLLPEGPVLLCGVDVGATYARHAAGLDDHAIEALVLLSTGLAGPRQAGPAGDRRARLVAEMLRRRTTDPAEDGKNGHRTSAFTVSGSGPSVGGDPAEDAPGAFAGTVLIVGRAGSGPPAAWTVGLHGDLATFETDDGQASRSETISALLALVEVELRGLTEPRSAR